MITSFDSDNSTLENQIAVDALLALDAFKFDRVELLYTSCYCEENIYMLCLEVKKKKPELLEHCSVMYISNDKRAVPLWQQVAGREEDHAVVWDYHVVLYYNNISDISPLIYDFDTILPFPCPADYYIMETFKPNYMIKEEYKPSFRFVSANTYLEQFQSDRSHMLRKDGTYAAVPPTYPAITRGQHNLDKFISMEPQQQEIYGQVMDCDQFYQSLFGK